MKNLLEKVYYPVHMRNFKCVGDRVSYDVFSKGWFPTYLFSGTASSRDFVRFVSDSNMR